MSLRIKNLYADKTNQDRIQYYYINDEKQRFCENKKCNQEIKDSFVLGYNEFLNTKFIFCSRCFGYSYKKNLQTIQVYLSEIKEMKPAWVLHSLDKPKLINSKSDLTVFQAIKLDSNFTTDKRVHSKAELSIEGATIGKSEALVDKETETKLELSNVKDFIKGYELEEPKKQKRLSK